MQLMIRRCWPLALAAALLAAGCAARGPEGATRPHPAASFSFTTLEGETIVLEDLGGRPVALNFWTSWCPSCAMLAPHLQALYEEHQEQGLVVLGISPEDTPEALRAKAQELGIRYPVGVSAEAARAYGVRSVPVTYFIDREGRVVSTLLGAQTRERVREEIEKLL